MKVRLLLLCMALLAVSGCHRSLEDRLYGNIHGGHQAVDNK